MKFAHLADLHIGRRLCEASLLDDQKFAFDYIISEIAERRVDAVLISGDVYDRALPGADAVALCDSFLERLAKLAKVFVIGGNHDSQERLAFARDMLEKQGLVISRPYGGRLEKYSMGDADIWLMPYIRPAEAQRFFPDVRFAGTEDAVSAILAQEAPDPDRINIILAHQFVTSRGQAAITSESEIEPVGGENSVDVSLFDAFDYAALGHLHAPQRVGRDSARYAGSPIKYSFSEALHNKSFVVGETGAQGVSLELVPIPVRRGMRDIKGELSDILAAAEPTDDYVRVTLTDKVTPESPMERLSLAYPNLLRLEMALIGGDASAAPADIDERSPMELFSEFFETMTGGPLTAEMLEMSASAFDAVQEGGAGE